MDVCIQYSFVALCTIQLSNVQIPLSVTLGKKERKTKITAKLFTDIVFKMMVRPST